ncbi:hypothetical protein [Paracoccus sp. (in: a-proteobacteria)]|uniref:hypothetical protein n=1 Tax=Paracoccus sp. TaxID=267 RepID=UPI004058E799
MERIEIEVSQSEAARVAKKLGVQNNHSFKKKLYSALDIPLSEDGFAKRFVIRFGDKDPNGSRLRQVFQQLEEESAIIEASGLGGREAADEAFRLFKAQYPDALSRIMLQHAVDQHQAKYSYKLALVKDEQESDAGMLYDHRANISESALGMVFWNNGVINTKSRTKPGPDFVRGMLKRPNAKMPDQDTAKLDASIIVPSNWLPTRDRVIAERSVIQDGSITDAKISDLVVDQEQPPQKSWWRRLLKL